MAQANTDPMPDELTTCAPDSSSLLPQAATEQQAPPPLENDFELIKSLLEPYWHIFTTVVSSAPALRISQFSQATRSSDLLILCLYTDPPEGEESALAVGPAVFPPDTPPELQIAVLKLNCCDFAAHILLPYLITSLQRIRARVDWILVEPLPRILLFYDIDPDKDIPYHSVLLITTSSGSTYIADFTIEQLGYPSEMWFMKKDEYLNRLDVDGGCLLPLQDWMDDMDREIQEDGIDSQWLIREATREVCGSVASRDTYTLETLRARAVEVVRRLGD